MFSGFSLIVIDPSAPQPQRAAASTHRQAFFIHIADCQFLSASTNSQLQDASPVTSKAILASTDVTEHRDNGRVVVTSALGRLEQGQSQLTLREPTLIFILRCPP